MSTTAGESAPLRFIHRPELRGLPDAALAHEIHLHGGFAVDKRDGFGQLYYGMPGTGIMRVAPDLSGQDIIELPDRLRPMNFHSTRLADFDGETRLVMPANNDAMVAVLTLDGDVDFVLSRPEFDEYADTDTAFKPTDTALLGDSLYVADGYGANYIVSADPASRKWTGIFGGKTLDGHEHGRFGTAHGLQRTVSGELLSVADRLHSRIELYTFGGAYRSTVALPAGSRPCGIDLVEYEGRSYAVVGTLDDPEVDKGRSAPLYVLDGETYEVLATIRPKDDLGVETANRLHNVVWHQHDGRLFLVGQSFKPGCFFVLEHVA